MDDLLSYETIRIAVECVKKRRLGERVYCARLEELEKNITHHIESNVMGKSVKFDVWFGFTACGTLGYQPWDLILNEGDINLCASVAEFLKRAGFTVTGKRDSLEAVAIGSVCRSALC